MAILDNLVYVFQYCLQQEMGVDMGIDISPPANVICLAL